MRLGIDPKSDFAFKRLFGHDIEKRIDKPRGPADEEISASRITLSPDKTLALIVVEPHLRSLLELWDVANCKRRALWTRRFYHEYWNCIQFSPDGKRVVTSSDRGLKVWDVASGRVERAMDDTTTWTSHHVDQLAFSSDGKRVLAVSYGGHYLRHMMFGSDGKRRLWSDAAGYNEYHRSWATVYAVETGAELRSWESSSPEGDWKSSAFSPDGRWVAFGSEDGQIRLLDVGTGRELVSWDGHETAVTALLVLSDGNTLVSGSQDGTLKLWNLPFIHKGLATLGLDWDASE